jgi:RNA polymerase sigma factor (sigma-70 family)
MNDDPDHRFATLCDLYTERLVRDLVCFGRTEHDARDLVQDTLLASWKHLDTVAPGAEWSYLQRAAHRRAINQATRTRETDPLAETQRDKAASAEDRLVRRDEVAQFRQRFNAAMAELPEESRLYLVLRRRGVSPKEIAERLGVPRTAVRTRLMRAAHHLRERVGPPPDGVEWSELTGEIDDQEA